MGCAKVPDEEQQRLDEMRDVLREMSHVGAPYRDVTSVDSREWHSLTLGIRSVVGALMETALVRVTEGLSHDLAQHIRAFYAGLQLLRLQARQVVKHAMNMHGGPWKRLMGSAVDEEAVIRRVTGMGRFLAGNDELEYVTPLSSRAVRRISSHFDKGSGSTSTTTAVDVAVDFVAALFGGRRQNAEVKAFIRAVEEVTGLTGREAAAFAKRLWERHGDLFGAGVTAPTKSTVKIGGEQVNAVMVAKAVLDAMNPALRENSIGDGLTRWLTRVSELEARRRAFPEGVSRTIDSVLGTVAPNVAAKVSRAMAFIDKEGWSPRYAPRLRIGGAILNIVFLGGAITSLRQLLAIPTAVADLGTATWLRGALAGLARLRNFIGAPKADPVDYAITAALQAGGGGLGGAAVPGVLLADRITRMANASAAVLDFKRILSALRKKYSDVEPGALPEPGVDGNVDRLRFLGFTDDYIVALIHSKRETPVLGLAYYTLRATDIGTGAPDIINTPEVTDTFVYKALFPFTRFLVRMGSNVFARLYKDRALRTWMQAKTGGEVSTPTHAWAIAAGWASGAKEVARLDYRYLMTLIGATGLMEHVLLDNAEDYLGIPSGSDPTLVETTQAILERSLQQGQLTPEDVRAEALAVMNALSEAGAFGIAFDLFVRNVETGKPVDVTLEEMVGRTPQVRTAGFVHVLFQFSGAAIRNRDAATSEEFFLRVARDMRVGEHPFLSDDQTVTLQSQYEILDAYLRTATPDERELVTEYLKQQTLGKVLSRLYGFPLVRNDYLIALHVDTPHHNRLLIDTLIRATVSDVSTSGTIVRGPGRVGDEVLPGISAKWQDKKFSLNLIEATLMARYGYTSRGELYKRLIEPERLRRTAGATIVRATRLPTDVLGR